MTLMDKLRADQLQVRKDRDAAATGLLSALIAHAAKTGKDKGNREPTDEETIAAIKYFMEKAIETKAALPVGEAMNKTLREIQILNGYMPEQMTAEELRFVVVNFRTAVPTAGIGEIMKHLKANHAGQYDGKLASTVAKEVLG